MLNVRKLNRLFISCFTFLVCLSMLRSVMFAQHGSKQGSNHIYNDLTHIVTGTKDKLFVDLTVLSQTAVVFGDEIDYQLIIRNDSALSITATTTALIPYGTRFNFIKSGSPTFTHNATSNQIEISPTHGLTLAAGESERVRFEVDTVAACGAQIVNDITLSANNESITRTKTAMIWDMIHASYNFEDINQSSNQYNLFTTVSGEWQVGEVISPTSLGVASGKHAWGTNLTGVPQSGQHVLEGVLDLSGLSGSNEIPLYLTWQEYFDSVPSANRGQVYIDGELVQEVSHSDFIGQVGYMQRVVNIQQFAGKSVAVKFVFDADASEQTHLGWYIDDLAVTQCNVVQFEMNTVISTDSTATCDMNSLVTNKKGHIVEQTGLILYEPRDVYYCYAIKNTGNVTLTEHNLTDNRLGEIITHTSQFTVPPGAVRDTVSEGIIISQTVAEHTSNKAIWRASPSDFYQVITSSIEDSEFYDVWGIGRILEVKDDSEIRVKLPFDFEYFGTIYEAGHNMVVGNNGGVLFANEFGLANVPAINTALPLTGTLSVSKGGSEGMNQAIFPFWDDLDDGWVLTHTQGTAPEREFIVQWRNMPHKNGSSYQRTVTFQARLYESSNEIAFTYKDVDFEDERFDYASSATIGLNKSQDSALQYAFNRDILTDGLEIRFIPHVSASDSEYIYLQNTEIELTATVHSDPEKACEGTNRETVEPNGHVTYCYTVKNTGNITLTHHTLTDTQLDTLIDYQPITLAPGMTFTFKSEPTAISELTNNQIEWKTWVSSQYDYKTSRDTNGPQADTFEDIGLGSENEGMILHVGSIGEVTVTMPFSFTFYGVTSNLLRVSKNGGILFDHEIGTLSPSNEKLPITDLPLAILPYWDSLDDETGNIYVKTMGETPQRRFIIQWDDVSHTKQSDDGGTFQVILYEGSNDILFQYEDLDFGTPSVSNPLQKQFSYGQSATIGLSQNARNAHEYAFNNGLNITNNRILTDGFAILWKPIKASAKDSTTVMVNFIPSIELTATVGIHKNNCATTNQISVTAGTTVYYCFMIENTGNVTLTSHNLSDTIVGINNIYNFNLAPGEKINITQIPGANVQPKSIMTTTANRTEWTAINHYDHIANDSASVQVNVNFQPPLAVTMSELQASEMNRSRYFGWIVGMLLALIGSYTFYIRSKK